MMGATKTRFKHTETGKPSEPGRADQWPVLSLHEADISLIDCEHRTPPASESGYPYVAIPQVRNGHIDLDGARRITREHFLEWTRKAHPEPYDVVLSRRCNPGETAFVSPRLEFAVGQNLVLLRANGKKVFKPFLRWLVRGPSWWEQVKKFINVGAVFDSLKCADIPNFTLSIPPLPEQRSIARILGALDDKIELAHQMNKTLEAIGKAIFKHWFVDFEFPNEEGKPYKSSGGAMDYNEELGREIPKDWKVTKLGDLLDNVREPLRPGEELRNRKYVPIDNLSMNKIGIDSYLPYTDARSSLVAFEKDDILLGAMRVYFHRVCLAPFPGITRTTTFVLRPKNKWHLGYCLLFLSLDSTINYANAHSRGTTIPYAVWEGSLGNLITVVPPEQILEKFNETLYPILQRTRDSLLLEVELSKIRDLLQPKLLSGKIRVPVEVG